MGRHVKHGSVPYLIQIHYMSLGDLKYSSLVMKLYDCFIFGSLSTIFDLPPFVLHETLDGRISSQ